MKKAFIVFNNANGKRALKAFQKNHGQAVMLASEGFLVKHGLKGPRFLPIEDFTRSAPHVFSFRHRAAMVVRDLIDNVKKITDFNVDKVSPLEVYAGPLTIYYFDKSLYSLHIAQAIFRRTNAKELIIDENKSALSKALIFEAVKNKVGVHILNKRYYDSIRQYILNRLWLAKELTQSMFKKKANMIKECDLCFICSMTYHHSKLVPIVKQLLSDTEYSIALVIRCNLPDEQRINHDRVQYIEFHHMRCLEYAKFLLFNLRFVKKSWINDILPALTSVSDWKISCPDGYIASTADSWFNGHINRALRSIFFAKIALNTLRPNMLISIDASDPNVKAFELFAEQKRIPYLCLAFGFYNRATDTHWRHWREGYVGAIGQATKEVIRELTPAHTRIAIVGDVSYDTYKPSLDKRLETRKKLKIPANSKLIAYMSFPAYFDELGQTDGHYSREEHTEILRAIFDIPKKIENVHVIIKPHPVESPGLMYELLKEDESKKIRVANDFSAYDVLNACDLAITIFSMTGFEAILLNKPLIVLDCANMETLDYITSHVGYPVKKLEALYPAITKVLQNTDYKKNFEAARLPYLEKSICLPYDKSSERCINLIEKIIKTTEAKNPL